MAAKLSGKARTQIRFTALEGLFWPTMCASYLLVILLQEQGFSNTAVGVVLAVKALIGVFIQPIWGVLCDWMSSVKKVFLACSVVTTVCFTAIALVTGNSAIITLVLVDAAFRCGMVMMLDNWVISELQEDGIPYGPVRAGGGIPYAVVSWLYAQVLVGHTMAAVIALNAVWAVMHIVLVLVIPERRMPSVNVKASGSPGPQGIMMLVQNRAFMAAVLLVFFVGLAEQAITTYLPNIMVNVGGESGDTGYVFALKAIAEIPFFFLSAWIMARISLKRLMCWCAALYAVAYTAVLLAPSAGVVIAIQFLPGAAYSLLLGAKLYYITRVVPAHLTTTAFTFTGAFEYGLGAVLANLGAGMLLDHFPVAVMIGCAVAMCVAGLLLFVWMAPKEEPAEVEVV